jgi:hypothetical protein
MEKNRRDEPIGVIIHVYMEMLQGTPCVAILNKQVSLLFIFVFYRIGEQEGRTGPAGTGGR